MNSYVLLLTALFVFCGNCFILHKVGERLHNIANAIIPHEHHHHHHHHQHNHGSEEGPGPCHSAESQGSRDNSPDVHHNSQEQQQLKKVEDDNNNKNNKGWQTSTTEMLHEVIMTTEAGDEEVDEGWLKARRNIC